MASMSIIELLPLLDGWEYETVEHEPPAAPKPLEPGGSVEIMPRKEKVRGWFISGGLMVDNINARVTMITDRWQVDVTAYGLYDYGLSIQPKFGAWTTSFVMSSGHYTVQLSLPWMPFNFVRHIFVMNPPTTYLGTTNTTCKLISYTFATIEITDVEKFKRSLREITAPPYEALRRS